MVPSPAARYSTAVAGIDEPSARSTLAAMQDRLARDPTAALGIGANATAADVRTAFLELTKLYHPVRFGRMALDIQKLSNEVFLALRAAHDALSKSLRRRSGPISAPAAAGRSSALGSQAMPPAIPLGPTLPPIPAKPRTPSSSDTGERPPVLPRTLTPTRSPTTRPLVARPPGAPATAQPPAPTGPVRPSGSQAIAGPRDEAAALELLQRQQWEPARSILHLLLAREPASKRIRALMCYARGREAQLDRRLDDARVELQDALDLDPDLQLAKTALTELFTRRK
jgi:hypothetical protein